MTDDTLREQKVRMCEEYCDRLQADLRVSSPNRISRGLEKLLGYPTFEGLQQWFIPCDHKDWEWTERQVERRVDDPKIRTILKQHFSEVRDSGYEHSFFQTFKDAPGCFFHFVDVGPKADELSIKQGALHEMMHALLRSAVPRLPLRQEELATDLFAHLALCREGLDSKDLFRSLLFRMRDKPEEHSTYKSLSMPIDYPSLAFVPEIEALEKRVPSDAPLTLLFDIAHRFATRCDQKKLDAWEGFCKNTALMVREGEKIPSILRASTQAADSQTRKLGIPIYALLNHAEKVGATQALTCNYFADEKTFLESHRQAQAQAFETAFKQAQQEGSHQSFYRAGAHHIAELMQGRAYGYAGDALVSAGDIWKGITDYRPHTTSINRAASVREEFEYQRSLHQGFDSPNRVAWIYADSPHRSDPQYGNMEPLDRLEAEIRKPRELGVGETAYRVVQNPALRLFAKAPELLHDPLNFSQNFERSGQLFREAYRRY